MASRREMEFTYSLIDRMFRLSIGERGDFSGAKYDGDFSLSLEEAQRRKHEYVAESLGLEPGKRVLDMGCGWGALLGYLSGRGAEAVGVTLSGRQAASCRRHGLDVHVLDCRTITRGTFGPFDGVASLGAFEHFCSLEDYHAGRQDAIYEDLFEHVAGLLATGDRLFLQTMVFGPNMIDADEVDPNAPRLSDAHVLGLMTKQFPGSWLPYGAEQVERAAAGRFDLVEKESGRLDYIETIRQWGLRFGRIGILKLLVQAALLPRWLVSRNFRQAFTPGFSPNTVCFERHLLDHFRFVFERR
jgi:cyclopropane-fatty-acyl-phospholipid synthase